RARRAVPASRRRQPERAGASSGVGHLLRAPRAPRSGRADGPGSRARDGLRDRRLQGGAGRSGRAALLERHAARTKSPIAIAAPTVTTNHRTVVAGRLRATRAPTSPPAIWPTVRTIASSHAMVPN